MKTKTITSLKKEVLVIEDSPAIDFYKINPRMLAFNMLDGSIKIFKGNFTILGKPEEITEDDVRDLVNIEPQWEENETFRVIGNATFSALKPFYSAIEKEIYWENPVQKDNEFDRQFKSISNLMNSKIEWMKAQQKTFDKSRTLIFLKN